MPFDLVTRIAGESEQNRAQREQLNKQLDVLVKGSETCKRFIGVRLLASADSLQEDVRSWSDRSVSCKSSPTEVLEFVNTEVRESKEEIPTVADIVEAPQEDLLYGSKKKSRKSKISAKQAIFEQD
ncbi:hypothetical protein XANCAGTX0491_000470 [Xanthoria calcicola]